MSRGKPKEIKTAQQNTATAQQGWFSPAGLEPIMQSEELEPEGNKWFEV